MKTLIHLFLTFLFLLPIVNAQEEHIYSSRENIFQNWIKQDGQSAYSWGNDYHKVGALYQTNWYEIRNFNSWQWTYNDIPTEATVTSVTVKFRVRKGNYNDTFTFSLHNIPYLLNTPNIDFYNESNSNQIYLSSVLVPDANKYVYFNMTFTPQSPVGNGREVWNAINSAVQSGQNYITLGIRERTSLLLPYWSILAYDGTYTSPYVVDLIINFTTPDNYYTFKNKIQTNESYGSLILNDNISEPIPSSNAPVFLPWGTLNKIRTAELPFLTNWNGTGTTQKHNYWDLQSSSFDYSLHHNFQAISSSPTEYKATFLPTSNAVIKNYLTEYSNTSLGNVGLIDPWFYYAGEGGQWIQDGAPHFYSSPFNIQNNSSDSYGGVFLNQNLTFDPTKPIYSVKAHAVQDIPLFTTGVPTGNGRMHKFYFQKWSGSNVIFQNSNALETPVVFTQDGAFAQAKLKGTQLSNTSNAFNSNSQRKYVKTDDGYLHLVYESMGSVWYEVSPDNGATWYIQNNGKPISSNGKQPAIDYGSFYDPNVQETYQQTVITWQEYYGSSSSKIKVAYFDRFEGVLIGKMNWRDTKDVATVSGSYSTTNCYPVVCLAYSNFNVVYKNGASGALLLRTGVVNIAYGIYFSINNPVTLTGTNSYSVNPSIAVNKTGSTSVRLVWEQIQDEYSSSIKYAVLVGAQISGSTTTISTNSGSPLNFSPSISIANNSPVVSWTGARNPGDGIDKRKAITTRGTNWGSFQVAGTDINFVNNNSALGTTERTVISWSEGTTNPVTKWMRREGTYYSTPRTLSNSGYQSQISSGTNFQTMNAMIFKDNRIPHSNDPHYFLKSTTDFSTLEEEGGGGLNKITENDTIVTFGRSGVASINDIEFVFEIGDILVGDSIIKFIEIPDTISYSSSSELNEHTRTSNFTLTPSTNFYFSNIYYVVTKSDPESALSNTDAVNFKAELVNALTNQVVGTFDNITYNKSNLEKYASLDYQVDCSGITPGDYYLRLVTNVNTDADFALANIINDNTTLAKKNFNKVNFTGSEIPITYDLAQNFPNPFNPSTIIRYQIPQDGIVTLKIYDILGAEVKTLVNEQKAAGKYEINFNASNFASGVYIYKIQAGSFTSSKKMLLIK